MPCVVVFLFPSLTESLLQKKISFNLNGTTWLKKIKKRIKNNEGQLRI
uniref:Uncharacterized protein n=1 Tax=Anguilla anguilla TaxID=7936 RepID=A0A0E9WB14_ANGAN